MSEKDEKNIAGKSSGTLRDDASGQPAGGKKKGGVFSQMFGSPASAASIDEAIEGHMEAAISQEGSMLSLRDFLAQFKNGADELEVSAEAEAAIRERLDVLREEYRELEGSEDPLLEPLKFEIYTLGYMLPEFQKGKESIPDEDSRAFDVADIMGLFREGSSGEATQFDSDMLSEILTGKKSGEHDEDSLELELGKGVVEIPAERKEVSESGSGSLVVDAGPHSGEVDNSEIGGSVFDEGKHVEKEIASGEEVVIGADEMAVKSEAAKESAKVGEGEVVQPEEAEGAVEEIPEEGVDIDVNELDGGVEPATSEAEKLVDSEKEGTEKLGMTQVLSEGDGQKEVEEDSWFTDEGARKPRGMGTGTHKGTHKSSAKREATVLGVGAGSDIFKEFDNDPNINQETEEWSDAKVLVESGLIQLPISDSSAQRIPTSISDSSAQRIPTSILKRDADALLAAEPETPGDTGIDGRSPTVEEMAQTRLSALGVQEDPGSTPSIEVSEDFSKYGDISYVVEQAFAEMGEDPGKLEGVEAKLELAVEYSELIANGVDTHTWDFSGGIPEYRRVQMLRAFKKDFIDVAEGSTEPKKDIKEYGFWIAAKTAEYEKIGDVFDILEIAPGEYSRRGVLRICEVALQSNSLELRELEEVQALVGMLEEKPNESDADEFAATRTAELTYEMITGFAIKRGRNLAMHRVGEIEKLEAQALAHKGSANQVKEKMRGIRDNLIKLYVSMKKVDEIQFSLTDMDPKVRDQQLKLESDYFKRQKIIGDLFNGVALEEEDGKVLYAAAKAKAKRIIGRTETSIKTAQFSEAVSRKQAGPIRKGIGNLVTMTAGAAILAAGMWLNQHGIISLGNDSVAPEQEKVVEVQEKEIEGDAVPSLPAGVVDGTLDGAPEPAPEEKAKVPAEEEIEEAPAKIAPKAKVDYPRTPGGLSAALDAHCSKDNAKGLFTSVNMLREAYATIDSDLAKKGILPQDKNWPEKIFRLRIKNPEARVAIMADLFRRPGETGLATPEQKYAAGIVLATSLGKRGGRPKRFKLPKGEKKSGSPIGKVESQGTRYARYAAVSNYLQVVNFMEQMKLETIGAGKTSEEFKAEVDRILGPRAKHYRKAFKKAQGNARDIYKRSEEKGGHRESYNLYTQGLIGTKGVNAISWVHGEQKKNREEKKELDEILGEAPKSGTVEKRKRPSTPAKKIKNGKKTSPKDETNLEFLERKAKEKIESSRAGHTANYRDGLSIRMGMGGNKIDDSVRKEKKEAYAKRFGFRGGVEKKPSPFKRIAAKLGMNKGLGKTTARA